MFGQVTIDSAGSKEIHEINLPGARISRDLNEKFSETDAETWCLMASCKNGLVVSLSARDIENEKKYKSYKLHVELILIHFDFLEYFLEVCECQI